MPASANDVNVRRHLAAVLRGDEELDAFIDWFQPARFSIHTSGSDEDVDLSDRIELHLAELSGGYIDDEKLLDALRRVAGESGIDFAVQRRGPESHRTVPGVGQLSRLFRVPFSPLVLNLEWNPSQQSVVHENVEPVDAFGVGGKREWDGYRVAEGGTVEEKGLRLVHHGE